VGRGRGQRGRRARARAGHARREGIGDTVLEGTETLIDYGAGTGRLALAAAHRLAPRGRVIALEDSFAFSAKRPAKLGFREHHPRLVRRTTMAIPTIRAIERRQIKLLDRRRHKPRKVILRQPLPQTRRQQQFLLTVTSNQVPGHTHIVINPPDDTLLYAAATFQVGSRAGVCRGARIRRNAALSDAR